MSAHRRRHPYAFLACRLSSKQLRAHRRGGGAASQPGERAAALPDGEPAPARYAVRSWHETLCFGASSNPPGPPTSPAENKAAPLLPLQAATALRNTVQNAEGMMLSISTQTCLITTWLSHLFCPNGSQSTSQTEYMKHHCLLLGNVCYRNETQRALEVMGRSSSIVQHWRCQQECGGLQCRHPCAPHLLCPALSEAKPDSEKHWREARSQSQRAARPLSQY